MPKQIISFTLDEETIRNLDARSKALGMNRSEFLELVLRKGSSFSEDQLTVLKKISEMQIGFKDKLQRESEVKQH